METHVPTTDRDRLHSAVGERRWHAVIETLEVLWPHAVHESPAELLEVLELVPESVLDERPRWIRARDVLRSRATAELTPARGPRAVTARIADLRRAGRAHEALALDDARRALLSEVGVDTEGERAELHYQWARVLEDVGATDRALAEHEAAAGSAGTRRMRSLAGGAAALLAALQGERARAERCLHEYCDSTEPLGGAASAGLARALLRVDVLDREGARTLLDAMEAESIGHRWALHLLVRALADREHQGPAHRPLRAEALHGTMPSAPSPSELDTVRIARYLLHTSSGRRDLAHAALGPSTGTEGVLGHLVVALRALDLVRIGRPAEARLVLAPLRGRRLAPRAELLMLVVAPDRFADESERIEALAAEHGLYRVLTLLPDGERRRTGSRLAGLRTAVPVPCLEPAVTVVRAPLTSREREVAEHAALGESTADIAAALFVSANTVKTQLRSVFRKLGVSSRDELFAALARAPREVPADAWTVGVAVPRRSATAAR